MKPSDCDVLVVGAGMAGLTAAAYCSRAGLDVLLCEKEDKTGGLVGSFNYNGFVFDAGIRATENSGIVLPMLRQLGIEVEFLPSPVSVGIGRDVIRIYSKDNVRAYRELLQDHFPEQKRDIAAIIREIERVMVYMEILYGIENPLFLDLKNNPGYVLKKILPWMLKYLLTLPKIAAFKKPVDEYLAGFSSNQALLDIIVQHFFQKTPAFFALNYFSVYLDYRYPAGGTGVLPQAMHKYLVAHGVDIRPGTNITAIDAGRRQAQDSSGAIYRYKKLIWAADLKTLYRVVDLTALADRKAVTAIEARRQAVSGKVGGDSVLTLYLTVNLEPAYFGAISTAHFFYTPSTSGLSNVRLDELLDARSTDVPGFVEDRAVIEAWLRRYLQLTTYEISCPVLRDASLAPAGKTGLIISSLFDFSVTRHIEAMGWYEDFKKLVSDCIVEVFDATIYPGLKAALIGSFASTPLTLQRISGNSEGAITGWAFTNDPFPAVNSLPRVARSTLTPIPDTYQAGQWTYSPSGLPIAILTGKLAADRVVKDLA